METCLRRCLELEQAIGRFGSGLTRGGELSPEVCDGLAVLAARAAERAVLLGRTVAGGMEPAVTASTDANSDLDAIEQVLQRAERRFAAGAVSDREALELAVDLLVRQERFYRGLFGPANGPGLAGTFAGLAQDTGRDGRFLAILLEFAGGRRACLQ